MQDLLFLLLAKWKLNHARSLEKSIRQRCIELTQVQKQRLVMDWFRHEFDNQSRHALFTYFIHHRDQQKHLSFNCSKFLLLIVLRALSLLLDAKKRKRKEIRIIWEEGPSNFTIFLDRRAKGSEEYFNDESSLDDRKHGMQQVHQFFQKLGVDRSVPSDLLPKVQWTQISNESFHIVNSVDAVENISMECLLNDQIRFESIVKDLFVEWIEKCRQVLIENMEPLGDMNVSYEELQNKDESDISMLILSLVPSQMHLLSFILDRSEASENSQMDSVINSWEETRTLYASAPQEKLLSNARENSVRVIIKFITQPNEDKRPISSRSLEDIETDLIQLLSRHPVYSVIYSTLYSKEQSVGFDVGNWMRIYTAQQTCQHRSKYDTIITQINSILHSVNNIHTQQRYGATEKPDQSQQISFDALNFESDESIKEAIRQSLMDKRVSKKKVELAQLIERSLSKVREEENLDLKTRKDQIFKDEWDKYQTVINREREKRRRLKYLSEVLGKNHHMSVLVEDCITVPLWKIFDHIDY